MNRLVKILKTDDIFPEYRQSPIGLLLEYHNLNKPPDNYSNARLYLIKNGLVIAEQIGAKAEMKDCFLALSVAYDSLNDFRNAFKYQKLYSQTKDSLFNEEKSKDIGRLEARYEMEKKLAE